ncbi:MAG: DEAD/DEAH box helicase, partial [Actinobacteria bacterium]|nr:DEAD/DEAH box helicase [Actinomycetota bacterium]
LEISRYWGEYEVDESSQELQVVVATDAKLKSMIDRGSQAHGWLRDAKLVVIDEAHRAGSPSYTQILRWLGITRDAAGSKTERPLLGLTATPYRGVNEDVNKQFVARFGERRLNALDDDDPIGQLIDMKVLSKIKHQLLDGVTVSDAPTEGLTGGRTWDDVSPAILRKLGDNLDRTQLLVDHIMLQNPTWPILVFTPSVVSAHVTAALLQSLGRNSTAVDGAMRGQERRRKIDAFKSGETRVLVNCDLLTQGFDAPQVRALYIARPTFSPNRYVQMVGRGLRGPLNGGTEECLVVNVVDTFEQFDESLAFHQFDYLWTKSGAKNT